MRVVHRSLQTSLIPAAKDRAKRIIEPILIEQWEAAEKLKSRTSYATIGQMLERYQADAEDRPGTIRNNVSALRLLIRSVHPGGPDAQNSSVLTGACRVTAFAIELFDCQFQKRFRQATDS